MENAHDLHQPTYEWMIRLFNRVRTLLGLNIKLHGAGELLEEGEIFVFNHFARIETFLPHWVIYNESGAFCRSIASKTLFEGNDRFANFLWKVGAIPNDHPELFPILIAEVLRGRKVIIFPEGGMVKDRKVQDEQGRHRVYSRSSGEYRKHHSGAAVLANAVNLVKTSIRIAERNRDTDKLREWQKTLHISDLDKLLYIASKRTTIVPCNITFFPLHTDEAVFDRLRKLINANINNRAKDELVIESNFLFKDTDMDMRPAKPIYVSEHQSWVEQVAQDMMARNMNTVNDFHALDELMHPVLANFTQRIFRHSSERIRDRYMADIYRGITVNIHHLASAIIMALFKRRQLSIGRSEFFRCLYLAIKKLQQSRHAHLHRGLKNPNKYRFLLQGENEEVDSLLDTAVRKELLALEQDTITLLPNLGEDFDLDTVRLNNMLLVYANEMDPVADAVKAVEAAIEEYAALAPQALALMQLDDEQVNYDWHYQCFNKPRYDEVNQYETATESGRPYFMRGSGPRQGCGVLLVHGFLASPAEMRPLADVLVGQGYTVFAPRLAGHGTSPADLAGKTRQQWLESVQTGYDILRQFCDEIVMVGFSTGGLLSLHHAAAQPAGLKGVVSVNTAFKFMKKTLFLVPLLHGVSKMIGSSPLFESEVKYRRHESEHPGINYGSIPISALYHLLQLKDETSALLEAVTVPTLLMQSTGDTVVDPEGSQQALGKLVNAETALLQIDSERHGIIYENVGETIAEITKFIDAHLGVQAEAAQEADSPSAAAKEG